MKILLVVTIILVKSLLTHLFLSPIQVLLTHPPNLPAPPPTLPPPLAIRDTQGLPHELGKCIAQDIALLDKLGWKRFMAVKRPRKDLANLHIYHPARRLLHAYKT